MKARPDRIRDRRARATSLYHRLRADHRLRNVAALLAIDSRGGSEWYQPWDGSGRCDDRHSHLASVRVPSWQHPFYCRYDHLCHDHAARVPDIDAVSWLAAHAYEISSPTNRSLSNFFVNRRNV